MRRALLVAAFTVLPRAAAAFTAAQGQVLERNDFVDPVSYINAAQCAGTESVKLEWYVKTTIAFTGAGNYRIFAATQPPYASGTNQNYCAESDDNNASPTIKAGLVQNFQVGSQNPLQDGDVSAAAVVSATTDATSTTCVDGAIIYVCSHWYDGSSARNGHASGKFVVQLTAPNAPGGVGIQEGDTRLVVSWTPNGSTPVETDHYVARAFEPGGTTPVATASSNGSSATISGLANGHTYEVDVVAYSKGGNNPSAPSPSPRLTGTPSVTADFWKTYKDRGGTEEGGCASGAAGALSMLGAAALLALRRRKP